MANWFISVSGKAQGPKTLDEVHKLIEAGQLTRETLVFHEGETGWRKAAEIELFWKPAEPALLAPAGTWILLARNWEDTQTGKARYQQSGPFTKEELLAKIHSGEARWTDFVWKQGFKAWARISSLPDFSEEKSAEVSKPAVISAKNVVVAPPVEEEQTPTDFRIEREKPPVSATPSAPKVSAPIAAETPLIAKSPFFTPKRVAVYGTAFVAIAIVLSIGLLISNPESSNVAELPPPEDFVPQELTPPQAPPTPSAPAEPVAVTPTPRFIKIKPLKLESQPQLVFETNVDAGEPISVTLKADRGQVLEVIRYSRSIQLARGPNEVPTLDLSKWDLPTGSYEVEAKTAGTQATSQVFIGQKNRKFQTQLDAHKKKIALQDKNERKELVGTLGKLEKWSESLRKNYSTARKKQQAWTKFYKSWSKEANPTGLVGRYKPEKASLYVNPKSVALVHEASQDLKSYGKTLNESVKSKRAPASQVDIKSYQKRLKRIRESL